MEYNTRGEDLVMSFFDIDGAGLALAATDFTQQEFTERLVNLARDPDPKVASKALMDLRSHLRDIATINGRITSGTLVGTRKDDDGTTTQVTQSVTQLSHKLAKRPGASTLPTQEFLPPRGSDPALRDGAEGPS